MYKFSHIQKKKYKKTKWGKRKTQNRHISFFFYERINGFLKIGNKKNFAKFITFLKSIVMQNSNITIFLLILVLCAFMAHVSDSNFKFSNSKVS